MKIRDRVTSIGDHFAVYSRETREFTGYTKVSDFWKTARPEGLGYASTSANPEDLRYYRTFDNINVLIPIIGVILPEPGDRIFLAKRTVTKNGEEYNIQANYEYFLFPSSEEKPLYDIVNKGLDYNVENGQDVSKQIIGKTTFFNNTSEENIDFTYPKIKTYVNSVKKKKFKRADGSEGITEFELDIIESVAFIFNALFGIEKFVKEISPEEEDFMFIFDKHFDIINDVDFLLLSKDEYHRNFNLEYFQRLRVRLLEFYSAMARGRWHDSFRDRKTILTCWIVGLFTPVTLRHLSYGRKEQLLLDILINNKFLDGRWNPFQPESELSLEEVIVKITQSIPLANESGLLNYNEINDFMTLLNSVPCYEATTTNENLFQKLYGKIDDAILFGDDGQGALGQFVKAVYALWLNSKYNPNNDAEYYTENELEPYKYTAYDATWKFEEDTIENEIDDTAAPALLNYQSEKVLLWYNDNFKFPFYKNKIAANIQKKKDVADYFLGALYNIVNPFKPFLAKEYIPHGFYDIFQPVSIANIDDELQTIIKIPFNKNVYNPCGTNPPGTGEIEAEKANNNTIPIFFLKYVDDLGDYSDFKQTISAVVDVALTFTGIGNLVHLAKIRHLNKFSVVRQIVTRPIAEITAIEMRGVLKLSFATWELLVGTVSAVHNLVTDGCQNNFDPCNPPELGTDAYEDYKRCQAIQGWLFAVEIMTLGVDVIGRNMLRKSSKEIQQYLPDDFPTAQRNIIDGLADITNKYYDYLRFLRENEYESIRNVIEGITDEEKRYAFMFAFGKNKSALDLLAQNDAQATERWFAFFDKKVIDRNDLDILTDDVLYNRYDKFYSTENLAPELNSLSKADRQQFMDSFKDQSDDWMQRLDAKPEAIGRWNRMTADMKVVAKDKPDLWLYIIVDLPPSVVYQRVPRSTKFQIIDPSDGKVYFRANPMSPPEINIENWIKFKKLSIDKQGDLLRQADEEFLRNASTNPNAYTPAVDNLRIIEGIEIRRTRNGVGIGPDFEGTQLYFQQPIPPIILGDNIVNDIQGLTDSLENIIEKIIDFRGQQRVPITGEKTRKADFRNSWISIGVNPADGLKLQKQLGLTWHHVDDLDINNHCTMQLVRVDPHASISHSGAVKQMEILFNLINDL